MSALSPQDSPDSSTDVIGVAARRLVAQRAAHGLSPVVEDAAVLERVAGLLDVATEAER